MRQSSTTCLRICPPLLAAFLAVAPWLNGADSAPKEPPKPDRHHHETIEGWKVFVDERLRQAPHAELGETAEALLRAKLADIVAIMPADRVEWLRQVPIWLDLSHGRLSSMQYHPSVDWLKSNGFDPALAKAVHIPSAARFADRRHQQVQPWCVLHELAHAYHDQVLGFDHVEVVQEWKQYSKSGHGDRALHVNGRKVRHYALVNAKEFFAEMTEAYFGTNDFYPFVHGELREAEPAIYSLLKKLWGTAPVDTAG